MILASATTTANDRHTNERPPTHCPACGREFGKQAVLTVAAWFFAGTPRDCDMVHVGCADISVPLDDSTDEKRHTKYRRIWERVERECGLDDEIPDCLVAEVIDL